MFFVILALLGSKVMPQNPLKQDLNDVSAPPSLHHLLGTDELGRDFLSRIMAGARTAMLVATLVAGVSAILGIVIGLISAYAGGWVDGALMRFADVLMAFPSFLFAAFINATLRPPAQSGFEQMAELTGLGFLGSKAFIDYVVVFGSLAAVSWYGYARLIRSEVLSLREKEFVEAERALGASTPRIVFRHILPNSIGSVIVVLTVNFGNAILAESALSYLGIGIQPPTPSWGQMIFANLSQWRYYPNLVLAPGVTLALVILGFNLLGDGIADALDPRRGRR